MVGISNVGNKPRRSGIPTSFQHTCSLIPLLAALCFITSFLDGCAYLSKKKPAYSKKERDIKTDTTFNCRVDKVLSALKEALLNMEFEIESEDTNSITTFPITIGKTAFGEYAVKEGYEPVSEEELYEAPLVKLQCFITPVDRRTRIEVKTLFEAYKKQILYTAKSNVPPDLLTKGYQEFKGEEIKCISTGKLEKTLLARVWEILLEHRRRLLFH